jgi:predicted phosphodiesterase
VERAIEVAARAVVLAGDVVEGAKDRFEAYVHLQQGAKTLADEGIPVFAVVGNHDVEALPRLADRVPQVTLLGRGGRWQCVAVPGRDDEPQVDLLGWSFPHVPVTDDPTSAPERQVPAADHSRRTDLERALDDRRSGSWLIGVVHGDLNAPSSRYAPLSRANLEAAAVDAWFLGHIHRPDDLRGPRPIGYLGSLSALDAGETGLHGPWELSLDGALSLRHVPLSPVRFEDLEVLLEDPDLASPDQLLDLIGHAVRERLADDLDGAGGHLKLVAARVTVSGRLPDHSGLDELVRLSPAERLVMDEDPPVVVTRITDRVRPAIELRDVAQSASPAGELARTILALEDDPPPDLLGAAREQLRPWRDHRWKGAGVPDPPDVRDLLLAAAWRALEAVLEHRTNEERRR